MDNFLFGKLETRRTSTNYATALLFARKTLFLIALAGIVHFNHSMVSVAKIQEQRINFLIYAFISFIENKITPATAHLLHYFIKKL